MGAVMNFLKKTPVLPTYLFMKKVYRRIKKYYILRIECPGAYNKYKNKPIEEDKVVFVEIRHPQITNSFQELYDALAKDYHFRVHSHFLRVNFVSNKEYRKRCCDMLSDIATAKYVFVNDGSNVIGCIKKRPETVLVQTWHGCGAFKKFGYSTAELIFGDSRKEMDRFPNHNNYSYVTVSSPEIIWAYEEAMHLENKPGTVVATGSSRTDIFYREEFIQQAKKKLLSIMPEAEGKKVLLYAPTFRGRVAKARTPNMLNIEKFYENFHEEYVLLFKHHPLVTKPPIIDEKFSDFALDVTKHMSIEELICVSDICISDYSSLVFEFSLFEKPMIFYSYDLDEYFDWRGFYYDYYELAPGPVFTTNKEMIDYIKHVDERFDRQRVIDFRNKFMSSCDGHATEKILRLTMGEEVLNRYRREKSLEGSFYQIPQSDTLFSTYQEYWEELNQASKKAPAMYENAARQPMEKGKVVFVVQDTVNEEIIWNRLERELGKKEAGFSAVRVTAAPTEEFYREIATAEFLIMQKACPWVNAVKLRQGTKTIQMDSPSYPVQNIGYDSAAYRSGYHQESWEYIPLHGAYDLVPVNSRDNKKSVASGYGVKESVCKIMGSLQVERMKELDEAGLVRRRLEEGLEEVYPPLAGRKIMVCMPTDRYSMTVPNRHVFLKTQELFEELRDEYLILYHINSPKKIRPRVSKYYKDAVVEVTDYFTLTELLSVADVAVGDYRPEILDFAATGKPTFFYIPDRNLYTLGEDTGYSYPEFYPGEEIHDAGELVEKLRHPELCDWSRQEEFCQKYAEKSDGKLCHRIVKWMEGQEASE